MSRRREVSGVEETSFDVRSHDVDIPFEAYARRPKFPVTLVLDNLRSAFNVGSIFRTSDGCGIQHLYLAGITPTPAHADHGAGGGY